MNLSHIAFIAPLLGVLLFFLFERYVLTKPAAVNNRVKSILSIEVINIIFNYVISLVVLIPLVFLIAPLQVFSFANMNVPIAISFIFSFLFLDFANYIFHVLSHKIPLLWRFHRLHHSDQHVDSLTAFLHHPLEVLSSFLFLIPVAVITDVPVIVLMTYGIVMGLHSPFTHLRTLIPDHIEKYLQYIFVTPNFHRIHHSLDLKEGNANFGIVFIFWDLIFRTVIAKKYTLEDMKLGIVTAQRPRYTSINEFLKNPFH